LEAKPPPIPNTRGRSKIALVSSSRLAFSEKIFDTKLGGEASFEGVFDTKLGGEASFEGVFDTKLGGEASFDSDRRKYLRYICSDRIKDP